MTVSCGFYEQTQEVYARIRPLSSKNAMANDTRIDISDLFALTNPEGMPPPTVSPAYDSSALQFLEGIHRRKSDALKAIVEAQGWPELGEYSEDAQATAFMIVQHADYDPQFQLLCHQLMLKSAKEGKTKLGFIAFLTDRILCNQGKYQRFGTQIREVRNGCFVPKPIEDPDHINELRIEAGIEEDLSDYYARVNAGDLLLYRHLLGEYAGVLEHRKETKIIEFPVKST
jgi:hypothetical protein